MPSIKERLRRIVFAASVKVDAIVNPERKSWFDKTKEILSGIFWVLLLPVGIGLVSRKAHVISAHRLGIEGTYKQIEEEYKTATAVPKVLRNDLAKTFIRRAVYIDTVTVVARIATMLYLGRKER